MRRIEMVRRHDLPSPKETLMGRRCSICAHAERDEIDRALVAGIARTRLERDFGVTEQSLARHARGHLPLTLARAAEVTEGARADDLLAQVRRLQAETLAVLEAAKADRNLAGVLAAVDRAQKGVALMGGMFASAHAVRSAEANQIGDEVKLPAWLQLELRALGERYARSLTAGETLS
jgi:hypothetical protein